MEESTDRVIESGSRAEERMAEEEDEMGFGKHARKHTKNRTVQC